MCTHTHTLDNMTNKDVFHKRLILRLHLMIRGKEHLAIGTFSYIYFNQQTNQHFGT